MDSNSDIGQLMHILHIPIDFDKNDIVEDSFSLFKWKKVICVALTSLTSEITRCKIQCKGIETKIIATVAALDGYDEWNDETMRTKAQGKYHIFNCSSAELCGRSLNTTVRK